MTFKTVIGDLSFDKKGDVMHTSYVVSACRKGPDGRISYYELYNYSLRAASIPNWRVRESSATARPKNPESTRSKRLFPSPR
ncbi:MAG: hypothetical protein WA238_11545, partial [Methylocella sp.]